MSYYEVNSASGALIDFFETEGEAGICAGHRAGATVVEVEGEMPKKFTMEDARRVMAELNADTPENRARQTAFKQWADTNPGWLSIKEQFGSGNEGNQT